ncbi:MAG: alpha/beta hydrolase [Nevskiales bacterium]|nr:alpha/beta hydrolase [Nevskiales bacterium]
MSKAVKLVEFQSHGTTIRGAWFRAADKHLEGEHGLPCVVMAHGLGGTRAARLDAFAERFAAAGLEVLVFDYRSFGASDGQPRQHFGIRRQLDDWKAAISFARAHEGIDTQRIALWGSSFSGGHVITAAAEDGAIAAVSSQGPMMDGRAAFLNVIRYAGLGQALKITLHAAWDTFGALTGIRHYIPIVGQPGEIATMTSADAESGYKAIVPNDWVNEITTAWMLELPLYRPVARASALSCPTLIGICTQDSVAPTSAAEETARRIGAPAEVKRYDIGHFDIYVGDGFEQAVGDQVAFFTRVLRPATPVAEAPAPADDAASTDPETDTGPASDTATEPKAD